MTGSVRAVTHIEGFSSDRSVIALQPFAPLRDAIEDGLSDEIGIVGSKRTLGAIVFGRTMASWRRRAITLRPSRTTMKRITRKARGGPLRAWTALGWRIGEMSMASAQVIAHRTARMAAAGSMPNARDRQEFTRMGREKIEAATESSRSMAAHLTTLNLEFGARAFRRAMIATAALMSLAASRNIAEALSRQAKLARTVWPSATTTSQMSHSAAGLARRGLKPIHARATANARRLGKR